MKLLTDTRAGAGNALNFLVALGLAAGIGYMMHQFSLIIIPMMRDSTDNEQALQSIQYSEYAVEYWPVIALLSACIWFIVAEIVDRRLGI